MNYVIFHDDLDGYMSAAVAAVYLTGSPSFHVTQYNEPFPLDLEKVTKNDALLILDFSYSKEFTLELKSKFRRVITIDHHDSALENLTGVEDCHIDNTSAGCILTWKYLNPGTNTIPDVIQYADDYDRYIHATGFSYAIQAWFKATPTKEILKKLQKFMFEPKLLREELAPYKVIVEHNESTAQSFSRSICKKRFTSPLRQWKKITEFIYMKV